MVNCGFVTKTEESLIPRVPLRYRYFHATGFVESNLNYYIVSSCISVMFRYVVRFSFYFLFFACIVPAFSSSADRDYYRTLGVPENASQDEIKKAFHSVRHY